MGQQSIWRRPTRDDYEWPEGATDAQIEEALRKSPPIRTEPAPQQDALEFGYQATKSLNPYEMVKGTAQAVMHPVDTATGLATAPGDMLEAAKGEWRQGNYGQAITKGALSTLPFIGAGLGGAASLPAGGTGAIPGYMGGVGIMSGLDEAMEQGLEGNYATAAGQAIDAAVQGFQGRGAVRSRPSTPSQLGSNLEQRVAKKSEQLFAPVVGHHKANYGNVAEEIGGRILRETKGTDVPAITREITSRRDAARTSLNAAYDRIPPGFRMKTDVVKQALQSEIDGLKVRNNNGQMVVPEGHRDYANALNEALTQLNGYPGSIPATEVRNIRSGWDNLADFHPGASSDTWTKADLAKADAFKKARTFLNEQTKGTWPQLTSEMDNSHFSIQAADLLQALHESERGRPKVGRGIMSSGLGAVAALASGKGTMGVITGSIAAPIITNLVTEKLGPEYQVRAGRVMANMAEEIRANGQTPKALAMLKQLQQLALTANRAGRANERVQTDQAVQLPQDMVVSPEQAAAKGNLNSWFDSVLQKGGR